jgi:hypothetical protein
MAKNFVISPPSSSVSVSSLGDFGNPLISGWFNLNTHGNTVADLIAGPVILRGAYGGNPLNGNITYSNSLSGNANIYLTDEIDIGPFDFFGLPPGFTLLSATLLVPEGSFQITDAGGPSAADISATAFLGSNQTNFNQHLINTGDVVNCPALDVVLDMSFPAPTMLDLMLSSFGIIASVSTNNAFIGVPSAWFSPLFPSFIIGTYEIQAVVISPISIENTSPARVGDKIIINSTLPILLGATQIQLTYPGHEIILVLGSGSQDPYLIIDGVIYYWINLVFIQTDFQMQFYLPFGFGRYAGPVTITLIGNGTQFSGSVLAGVLNVLYADASGIYSLTEGQINDTLYFRDGYTTDIKFLFLNSENEIYDDNYFSMKQERLRMLAMNDFEYEDYEDYEDNFFTITGALRIPVTTIETEIPSPFVMTAFLP